MGIAGQPGGEWLCGGLNEAIFLDPNFDRSAARVVEVRIDVCGQRQTSRSREPTEAQEVCGSSRLAANDAESAVCATHAVAARQTKLERAEGTLALPERGRLFGVAMLHRVNLHGKIAAL